MAMSIHHDVKVWAAGHRIIAHAAHISYVKVFQRKSHQRLRGSLLFPHQRNRAFAYEVDAFTRQLQGLMRLHAGCCAAACDEEHDNYFLLVYPIQTRIFARRGATFE